MSFRKIQLSPYEMPNNTNNAYNVTMNHVSSFNLFDVTMGRLRWDRIVIGSSLLHLITGKQEKNLGLYRGLGIVKNLHVKLRELRKIYVPFSTHTSSRLQLKHTKKSLIFST